jgi:tRNA U55 pseudouridine synthase TruB
MQSGAHLIELIRTKIGIFNIEESVDIKEFEENLKLL